MKKDQGLTLIELLVVISILLIILGITIQSFRYFQGNEALSDSAEKIINILRMAQSKTLASEGTGQVGSQYGVYFDKITNPHQYTLFKGANYAADPSSYEVHQISKSVEIYEINLAGGGQEVVFNRLTGETGNFGKVSLMLKSDNSKTRTIGIQSSGKITLGEEAFLPDDSGRKTDSRHVHFDLGWSIQNATALKFYFPNTSEWKTVDDITSYFDAGKTEFDWEGLFSIGTVDQIFRIHTHSLDMFDTLLCINRDRNNGKTNQEVIIYIVDGGIDKDIAHYLADLNDTVNKGVFVVTKEVQ